MSGVQWDRLIALGGAVIAGIIGYFLFLVIGFLTFFFGTLAITQIVIPAYREHVARLDMLEDRVGALETEIERLSDEESAGNE